MQDRLYQVVAEVLDIEVDSVSAETSSETVETWDSLTHLRLITAVESEFGVQLSMETIQSIETVGDLEAQLAGTTNS